VSPALAARLVWRDLRGSPHLLWIVAAVALGVATLAAVGTARDAVLSALERDAAVLLGGDVALETTGRPIPAEQRRALVPPEARTAEVVSATSILSTPEGDDLTVALKAVDDAYPLLGEVRLDPPMPMADALADGGLVVAPGVLQRLGVARGDRVRIGEADFTIRAVLEAEPDRGGGAFRIGPRVIADRGDIEGSGILRRGSVARYELRLALPAGTDVARYVERLRAERGDAGYEIESASDAQPDIAELVGRLATFLTLASLAALMTGGLGIALAGRTHLGGKLATMATLRALGGRPAWVVGLYALQLALLGAAGVAVGVIAGALLPFLLTFVPTSVLPVAIERPFAPTALATAAAIGALVLAASIWLPLAMARRVSPASLFRGGAAADEGRPTRRDLYGVGAIGLALAALVIVSADDAALAAWVLGSILAGAAVLFALVVLLQRAAGRLATVAPPRLRLPLREIARPGGETTPTVLALALGLALLTVVGQTGRVIDAEIAERLPQSAPSTVFLDIQPGMEDRFAEIVEADPNAEILELTPYLRARVVRIDGVPAEEAEIAPGAQWTLERDRGITWRAEPPAGEEMTAGEWWPADYDGPVLVAVEDETAVEYGVGVGDTLSFNVLGRVLTAEIAALRPEIDWSRGQLAFLFTFSPGVISNAPHSYIAAVDVPPEARPALLERIGDELPTVTPVLIDEAIEAATNVLERIRAAIFVVAGLTLASGLIVLAAGLTAVRARQRYAGAILKALGARRADLARTFLIEHAATGALAAVAGALLGAAGGWAIARFALELPFVLAGGTIVVIFVVAMALTAGAGMLGLARLVAQPAQPLLRAA
jgi:putative ABC transport system permease protein